MRVALAARRSSQVFFLALFVYIIWSTTYPLRGLLPPSTLFSVDPLVMIFTSVSERVILPGLALSLAMLAVTLVIGRFFCGWVCPMGTTIDMTGALRKGAGALTDRGNRQARPGKYIILGIITIASAAGVQWAWIFDPMVIMARFVSLNLIPAVTLALDSFFIALIGGLHIHGPLQDLYRALKSSLLGVHVYYFSHAAVIFLVFAVVCGALFLMPRLWCRTICPLGTIYSLAARFAIFRRVVGRCARCMKCRHRCRMGAIRDDLSYAKGECILCMDCIYDCPQHATRFVWRSNGTGASCGGNERDGRGISRRGFVLALFSSLTLMGFRRADEFGLVRAGNKEGVLRPPASLREDEFVDRCIRCGNCMKVCITNGLQPVMLEAGLEGIWTPRLVPEIGYCEYRCTLCGITCPTGAIVPLTLEGKMKTRLGVAEIDRALCLPWAQRTQCIVCEEHCPTPQKAIRTKVAVVGGVELLRPSIDEDLCIGCGICQTKCPARPVRAVRVSPRNADRR